MRNPLSVITGFAQGLSGKKPSGYAPYFVKKIDEDKLLREIASFFDMDLQAVQALWNEYKAFSAEKGYKEKLGEFKTLCMDEAFVMYVLFNRVLPTSIVEIGVQFGRSTRRIIDMKKKLGMTAAITSYDIEDKVSFFEPSEATLVIKDVTESFKQDVLDAHPDGGFLYLDAHPYNILDSVISGCMGMSNWALAIHDCTAGICNPHMTIPKDKVDITSRDGLWERYVLADAFGVENPLDPRLDTAETATHRMRIFSTRHGLALILPRDMSAFALRS